MHPKPNPPSFGTIQGVLAGLSRSDLVGLAILFFTAMVAPFFGGWDYLVAIRGETLSGNYIYTYNPYPAYWLFLPFALLPPIAGYLLWNFVNAAAFTYALRYWKANFLAFSTSLACFWNFFGGQYEGFFAAGFVLAISANPWLAGAGVFLLTFKPQVGSLLILFALLQRRDWRILALPVSVYLASFLIQGWWIPDWVDHISRGYQSALIGNTNISWYPVGIAFLALIFIFRKNIRVWILSASLAMPYFPVYSLATLFTIDPPPWWFNLGLWLFYLLPGYFPSLKQIPHYGFFIPLLYLAMQLWKTVKSEKKEEKGT